MRLEPASATALTIRGRLQYADVDSIDLVMRGGPSRSIRFEVWLGAEPLVLHPNAGGAYRSAVPRGKPLQWSYDLEPGESDSRLWVAGADYRCFHLGHCLAEPRFSSPPESSTAVLAARLQSGEAILAPWPEKDRTYRPGDFDALFDAFVGFGAWRPSRTEGGVRIAIAGRFAAADSVWMRAIERACTGVETRPALVFVAPGAEARVVRARTSWLVRWPETASPPDVGAFLAATTNIR